MLEFHRDRFVQLLHEVPAKETVLFYPALFTFYVFLTISLHTSS